MKITINAFRRIKMAVINTAKITILAGRNGHGKTSVLQAIAAAISPATIPVAGLQKNQILSLIHAGQPKSTIIVEGKDWMSGISYPSCDRACEGESISISEYASGMKNIIDEPVKQRSEIICKILKAYPTKEKLQSELSCTDVVINKIWETIQISGWDGAHEHAKQTGTKLKGQWEEVSGRKFGIKLAETWSPDNYEFDLSTKTETELSEEFKAEQEWLEIAISHETIENLNIADVNKAKEELPDLIILRDAHIKEIEKLRENYRTTKIALSNLSESNNSTIQKCPNCSTQLMVVNGLIVSPKQLSEKEQEKRKKEIDELNKTLLSIQEVAKKHESSLIDSKAQISACEMKINQEPAKPTTGKKSKATVEECRVLVEKAESRLSAFTKKQRADKLFSDIKKNQKIIDVLSPSGLRQAELSSALEKFNKNMKKMCSISAWKDVKIDSDMTISYGGWPWSLISKGERFRVMVILQLSFAILMKEPLVLIDDCDEIDTFDELLKILQKMPFDIICGMAAMECVDIENGVKYYWIEDGEVK